MRWTVLVGFLALVGCDVVVEPGQPTQPRPTTTAASAPPPLSGRAAARQFIDVVETVEPVAERECRRRTSGMNCDFQIVVDDRVGQPPNAFQTVDRAGRPVLAFTLALIAQARNSDELAFIMGHEAAHHIEGHIGRQQQNAAAGAVIFAGLATLTGGGSSSVQSAQRLGAAVGARTYSKDFELEADALGTIIAKRAGYDPVRGAEYFARIPDPGNRFLGTHPPNASRLETVRRVARQM